jgi:hypothetical protein
LRVIWEDLALPDLALSFKLAIGPIKMILAFGVVAVICVLGLLMDTCGGRAVVCSSADGPYVVGQTELDIYIQDSSQTDTFIRTCEGGADKGIFATLWTFLTRRFHESTTQLLNLGNKNIFGNVQFVLDNIWQSMRAVLWAFRYHPVYSVLFFTISFVVMCFTGGAISRCAALEFAQEERLGLLESSRFAAEKFRCFLSAPLIPMGMVIGFSLLVLLMGMLAALPWIGDILLSVMFVFLLLFGLVIFLMTIGVAAGGLLLYPAIAYEGTSGLDSIGRSFSYVLNRPIWMFYYVFAASVFGTLFYLVLRLIIYVVLGFTYALLKLGMGLAGQADKMERIWVRPGFVAFLNKATDAANWTESIASWVIYVFLMMIVALLLAYIISFVFSASTIIYALMRKKVDHVEFDQVFMHLEQVKDHDEETYASGND